MTPNPEIKAQAQDILEQLYAAPDNTKEIMRLLDEPLNTIGVFFGKLGMAPLPDTPPLYSLAHEILEQTDWERLSVRKIISLLTCTHIFGFPKAEVQKKAVAATLKIYKDPIGPLLHWLIEPRYLALP